MVVEATVATVADIIHIVPDEPSEVSAGLIKTLERLLAEAKSGEINGMVYVTCRALGVGHARRWARGWSGEGMEFAFQAVHGELAMLQYEMCAVRAMEEKEADSPEIG